MSVFVTDSTPCDNTPVLKITPRTEYKMPSWLKEVPTSFEPSGWSAKRTGKKEKQGDIIVLLKQKNVKKPKLKYQLYKFDGGKITISLNSKIKNKKWAFAISIKEDNKYNNKEEEAHKKWLDQLSKTKIDLSPISWKHLKQISNEKIYKNYKGDNPNPSLKPYKSYSHYKKENAMKTFIKKWVKPLTELDMEYHEYNLFMLCNKDKDKHGGKRLLLFDALKQNIEFDDLKVKTEITRKGLEITFPSGYTDKFGKDSEMKMYLIEMDEDKTNGMFTKKNNKVSHVKIIKYGDETEDMKLLTNTIAKPPMPLASLTGEKCKGWVDDLLKKKKLKDMFTFDKEKSENFYRSPEKQSIKGFDEEVFPKLTANGMKKIDFSEPKDDKEIADVLKYGFVWTESHDNINEKDTLDKIFTKPLYGRM